jgi:glycosyltransferase involved in cell wall biosynthesis
MFYEAKLPVRFLTSKFLWEKEFPEAPNSFIFFFKKSTSVCSALRLSQKYRQVLRALEYPIDLLRLVNYIKQEKPKIVHFNWIRLPQLDYLFIRYLKIKHIKVIYTVHNFLPHNTEDQFFNDYFKIYKSVDIIITLTEYVKNLIVQKMGIPEEKIMVIPHMNFAPIVQFYYKNPDLKKAKKNTDQKTILFFGGISPYKGLDVLIHSFKKVKASYPNCILKICGNSSGDFSQYNNLIENLGIDKNSIKLDIRFIKMKESIEILKEADLVVLPYKNSSQSGVIPFANTLGVPVIATCVGGIPEMIKEGMSGYCVLPNDPDFLAEKITEVLRNPDKLTRLKQGASQASKEVFSSQLILSRLTKIYHDLLNNN